MSANSKIIQIAVLPDGENNYPGLYALRDDGTIWVMGVVASGNSTPWVQVATIPEPTAPPFVVMDLAFTPPGPRVAALDALFGDMETGCYAPHEKYREMRSLAIAMEAEIEKLKQQ